MSRWYGQSEPDDPRAFDDPRAPVDPRSVSHVECDCVPDLGPSHCHLCSENQQREVAWGECDQGAGRPESAVGD